MSYVTLVLVGVVLVAAWVYVRWHQSFWRLRGVPTPPFLPLIGHVHKMFSTKRPRHLYNDEVYKKYGGSTFCGMYELLSPMLFIGDPELLKHILVKDFDHFTDRRPVARDNKSLMTIMLSNLAGEEWKSLRTIMSPTFTSGKMKGMFPLVCNKADALVSFCLKEAATQDDVDMKFNYGRFTLDTIASCAFGIECNSLVDKEAPFTKQADAFFNFDTKQILGFMLTTFAPRLAKKLGISFGADTLAFFKQVAEKTLEARRDGHKRGDFLDLMVESGKELESDDNSLKTALEDYMIIAQSTMFLIAGYDTTASTLACLTHLLATHPEHQQRLREEVEAIVNEHGDITYQSIMEAKFLDACIMETLRMYPPGLFGERSCTKDYKLPGTDLTIPQGTMIGFPIWSLHHDPRYWTDPEAFCPDRFMPENKVDIHPYTFMPFGVGPRNCIAMRFALMEAKVAIAKMLLASTMQVAPGVELEVECSVFILRPKRIRIILTPGTQ